VTDRALFGILRVELDFSACSSRLLSSKLFSTLKSTRFLLLDRIERLLIGRNLMGKLSVQLRDLIVNSIPWILLVKESTLFLEDKMEG
jgi:hypothetical protein